jgi:hypothetical protein
MAMIHEKIRLCIAVPSCLFYVSCIEKNPFIGKESLILVNDQTFFTESFAAFDDFLERSQGRCIGQGNSTYGIHSVYKTLYTIFPKLFLKNLTKLKMLD